MIRIVIAVVVGAVLLGTAVIYRTSSEAAPKCDVPHPPSSCATATPILPTPAPQLREAHIPILTGYFVPLAWAPSPFTYPSWYVRIDGARYPAGTSFRLDVHASLTSNARYCWALFDISAQAPVSNSQVCVSVTSAPTHEFVSSPQFNLPAAAHVYALHAVEEHAGYMDSARLVASWAE